MFKQTKQPQEIYDPLRIYVAKDNCYVIASGTAAAKTVLQDMQADGFHAINLMRVHTNQQIMPLIERLDLASRKKLLRQELRHDYSNQPKRMTAIINLIDACQNHFADTVQKIAKIDSSYAERMAIVGKQKIVNSLVNDNLEGMICGGTWENVLIAWNCAKNLVPGQFWDIAGDNQGDEMLCYDLNPKFKLQHYCRQNLAPNEFLWRLFYSANSAVVDEHGTICMTLFGIDSGLLAGVLAAPMMQDCVDKIMLVQFHAQPFGKVNGIKKFLQKN